MQSTSIVFAGRAMLDIARFAIQTLASSKKVLVADLSNSKYYIHTLLGDVCNFQDGEVVLYRDVEYTTDKQYCNEIKENYDIIFSLFDDYEEIDTVISIDITYVCLGMEKGPIFQLKNLKKNVTDGKYSIIFRGCEQRVKKYELLEKVAMASRREPDNFFFVPVSESDAVEYTKLEYGSVGLERLSEPLKEVVMHISARAMTLP